MTRLLYSTGRWAALHPWRAIGSWITFMTLLLALAAGFGGEPQDDWNVRDAPAQAGLDLLREHVPGVGNANARVVVLGYPRFYRLGTTCLGLSETKRKAINDGADHLNNTIAQRAGAHGFTFGDVRTTFTGHELCSGDSWLHSVNWLNIGESYHPKAAGQSGGYLPLLSGDAA